MYLAFSGPGGTGKSTMALFLEGEQGFNRVPSEVEYLRKLFYGRNSKYETLFPNFQSMMEFQKIALGSQVAMERCMRKSMNTQCNLVMDRSVYDYLAYTLKAAKDFSEVAAKVKNDALSDYMRNVFTYGSIYDGIVYFEPNLFVPTDDRESKEKNPQSINQTNVIMKNILETVPTPLLVLNTADMELRKKAVLEFNENLSRNLYDEYDVVYAEAK